MDARQLTPFRTFDQASSAAVDFLSKYVGFELWLVTRIEGDDWIVLNSAGSRAAEAPPAKVFRFADTVCSRMLQGQGPAVATRLADVPAYAQAPIVEQLSLAAYIGLPLVRPDGTVFGTLCAVDRSEQPEAEVFAEAIELLGRLLSTILAMELGGAQR